MCCRRPLILTSVAAVAAFSLLAAGCGGGGSPGVASLGSTTAPARTTVTQTATGLVGYAGCMRSHGVPNFPDPDGSGQIPKTQVVADRERNPSRFNSAENACRHLLPANGSLGPQETSQHQRTRLADGLSFARCMRRHGVTRFPDPNAQGQLSAAMAQAQGIDIHSRAVLRVVQACLPASHGALTPGEVRAALNNAHG
jgi:hypothetical protein